MGSGYSKMKKQAKLMEQQLEMMKQEVKNKKASGTSGNGLVTVVLNGDKQLIEITIKPECIDPKDPEGLQDLIKAACDQAYEKLGDDLASGGGMPSMPFGF